MAIAFYCEEEEDPKGYYNSYGYGYQLQSQQSQHAATAPQATGSQQPVAQQAASGVDENNNNSNNCALHGSSPLPADVVNNRQLMRVVLHQVLYRCTMEGALSPAHTSCVFCNKIYYLFQLLY
uniref:(northern house mosquito) hypothetical protein n=1 Tax=Culex pipiens TaxID=7175 RepID=A0A8D8GKY5_CULPI